MLPGTSTGDCPSHAVWSSHERASISARAVLRPAASTTSTRPPSAVRSRRTTSASVDLPHPLGPITAVTVPGRSVRVAPSGAAPCRPSWRTTRLRTSMVAERRSGAGRVPAGGSGRPRTPKDWSMAASPSVLAWNWVPTCRNGRYTSGARMSTTRAVRKSSDPESRRSPTLTATSAIDSVVSNSSTIDDKNAVRNVAFVALRCASPSARTRAAGPCSRPNATKVGRPASRSSTCAPRRCIDASRRAALCCVIHPTRAMNTGTSGKVTAMMIADSRSCTATTRSSAGVTTEVRRSCGRYRERYGRRFSRPTVTRVVTTERCSERRNAGPSATACARTRRRRSAMTAVAARSPYRSWIQAKPARAATTAMSRPSSRCFEVT